MPDSTTTVLKLRTIIEEFVNERDWQQFHAPKNLTMALSIEASELMEHFQWIEVEDSRRSQLSEDKLSAVREELADVLSYTLALANALDIDLSDAIEAKMVKNRLKYPADKFRGRSGKD